MAYKYKIGDRVRFLNETGGGRITEINEKGMVVVQTEDGFEIPVALGELIPDQGFSGEQVEEKEIDVENKQVSRSKEAKEIRGSKEEKIKLPVNVNAAGANVLVGFAADPNQPVFSSEISCFLINDSEFVLYYMAGMVRQGNYYHMSSGMLEANMKCHLKTFSHSELSKISDIHLQSIFVSDGRYSARKPLDLKLDISKINFSKESFYRNNDYFDGKAVIFGEAVKDMPEIAERPFKTDDYISDVAAEKKKIPTDSVQVDLHIENLIESTKELSPSDIIKIQLRKFNESIAEAIEKRAKRLIIVHGVGQGTLKMQIRKELQEKYPQYSFQDASFKEYGFGATLVHLHIIKKQ